MRLLGLVILIVGLVVLGFGLSSSQSITEKVVEGVSGRYTHTTMWYILGGLILTLGGGAIAYYSKDKS